MLIELVYSSTAVRHFSDEELADLLKKSVENNQKKDVTGLLLYSKGTFMQVLEGEADVVDELVAIIGADPRHRDIEMHLRTPAFEREFSKWHMGYRAISQSDVAALPNFAPFFKHGFNAAMLSEKPGMCFDIMKSFAALPA